MSEITALAQWFGGNRILADKVGEALEGCNWVGIPFAGGMAEVKHITARGILINDLHRHIVNLARVVADDGLRPLLIRHLREMPFHPEVLQAAQLGCKRREEGTYTGKDCSLWWAQDYFMCAWMGRSGKGGIKDEFNGRTAVRWNSNGGDSMVRYRNALRMLATFGKILRRCTFETMDGLEFIARCEDNPMHGIYCDPPFPEVGRIYKYNCGSTKEKERSWHTRLRDALLRFQKTRLVNRFYDHPLIRELYPDGEWTWQRLAGRKQTNEAAPEVLLLRNMPAAGLFQ